jgi:hypothetical protein
LVARLEESSALIAPVLLIGGLALAGGGYDVSGRHIAGLAVWLVVVGLIVLGAASGAKVGRALYWGAGLIGGLALWSALSSLWSGSVELSVLEADRVLVYLGFFLATFLIAQTDLRRQRFAEGLAIAVTFAALLGLGSRLLPHVIELGEGLGSGARLAYPLGYWNANGVMFGTGVAMLLWASREAASSALRWFAVGAIPALLLALYFTYSRGGLLALAVATGVLLALSRDRLWLLGTLAIGAIGALPALLAVQGWRHIADNIDDPSAVDQGAGVLLILLGGVALALLLFAGLRRLERRGGDLTSRAVRVSQNPRLLKGIAVGGALIAIAIAIAIGGRAWDQFTSKDIQLPARPESRFSDLSGAGRADFWRVATDAFGEEPLVGNGAGTYEFSWEKLRSIEYPVHDAHSLYLEAFAELGLIGGVLVLALVGFLLWTGFATWRAAQHPQRERYAMLLAAMVAFAVAAGLDWFWELAGLGAVFFLAAGVVVAARCAQLVPGLASHNGSRSADRRFGLALASVAVAWISAVALVGPLLVDRELESSRDAAAEGDIVLAVDRAERARSIEPWAASPYVQLGLLAQLEGDLPAAIGHFSDAIEREDHNWQWYYLRSKTEHEAGNEAAAQRDLERARELNPRAECLREGWNCG